MTVAELDAPLQADEVELDAKGKQAGPRTTCLTSCTLQALGSDAKHIGLSGSISVASCNAY
eukprot:1140715-Pelagomonas_calceolata.AAC.13